MRWPSNKEIDSQNLNQVVDGSILFAVVKLHGSMHVFLYFLENFLCYIQVCL